MDAPSLPTRLVEALAGRYRIERELGAGGMATVYLAEDVKHSRRVAIKVLKPELAAVIGADRFLTEIKTTANLQHPHILPLFDSGEADTYLFYVMPFIEGESLRDRLDRDKQLGVDEAVRIAKDVADALDYAHRHGVIHRDIKPANILLHDGRPLVADFGIALAISAAGGGRMTETGLSLGTPHYMSPEQASAERDLSARSDVYSLGCVLYEMLAGEPPHTGPNPAAILMRILTENPRTLSEIRPTVPLHVAGAVAKAVEKLPADRFQTAKQFRDALEDPAFRFSHTTGATPAVVGVGTGSLRSRGWDRRSTILAGTSVVLAASTLWFALQKPATVSESEGIISFQLADSVPSALTPAAGPDGWLAYAYRDSLYLRPPGALRASSVAGVSVAENQLSFSPDGEWIAYTEQTGDAMMVRKVPTRGGNPVTLATVKGLALGPYWADDGWIYMTAGPGTWALVRMSENGGALDTLLQTGPRIPFRFSKVSGRPVLFFGSFNLNGADPHLFAIDLNSRDTTRLIPGGYWPEWSATGHLLYARNEGSLFAVPVDPDGVRLTGSPVPVLDSLAESLPNGRYDLGPGGTLIYVAGRTTQNNAEGSAYSLRLDSIAGGSERIPLPPSDHWDAKFSPDGRQLAYIRNDHLWVYDLDLGTHTQLTKEGSRRHNPAWSPDGTRIVFSAAGGDDIDLFVVDAAGKTPVQRIGGSNADDFATQVLPDSSVLAQTQGSRGDVLLFRRGDSTGVPLFQADWVERDARVSPNGRWIAYISGESGRADLYVRRWPGLENKVKVSNGDAQMAISSFALWSKDSRALYYHQGQQVIAASVQDAGETIRITSRHVVRDSARGILADLHPDGRRLLFLALGDNSDSTAARAVRRLVVVTNWVSLLKQRMAPVTAR
jgi:eukaryotic-like serine/threonine-protein kinase